MNIIRMSGGIGNQMFQYALYLKLVSMGKAVKFDDVTEYALENARPVMLWVFGIDYPKASREEVIAWTDAAPDFVSRVRRRLFGRKSKEYHERSFDYDGDVLGKEDAYLCGCFQSERYFKDVEDAVREAFRFRRMEIPEGIQRQVLEYERQIGQGESVSIHIRRGDYLEAEQVYGGICTEAYYNRAVSYMLEKYPAAHFWIFTNDEAWAQDWRRKMDDLEDGRFRGRFHVVRGTSEETGYIDLMLMGKCRHHIIANSSFSWWGAWLNPSEEKCVIAPARWLNTWECQDIFTEGMVRVDAQGRVKGRGKT